GQLQREAFVASSRMLEAKMGDPTQVTSLLSTVKGLDVLFDSLGGAVADVGSDATAFPHRNALASVQIYKGTTSSAQTSAAKDVATVQSALAEIVGGGAYVNYIDPNMDGWAEASYKGNLSRLQSVANAVDPDRFFTFAQSIPRE